MEYVLTGFYKRETILAEQSRAEQSRAEQSRAGANCVPFSYKTAYIRDG